MNRGAEPRSRWDAGEPEEVAKAALFLASDDSSFVTGIELKLAVLPKPAVTDGKVLVRMTVQHGPRLLEKEDADVSAGLLELMKDEGIEVLLNSEVLKVIGQDQHNIRSARRFGVTSGERQKTQHADRNNQLQGRGS